MQDNFGRLVKVCFYSVLILIGFLAVGAKTGGFGVPVVLGIALFLILVSMQFGARMGKSKSEDQTPSLAQTISANKGGAITLLIIALVTIFVVIKAFG